MAGQPTCHGEVPEGRPENFPRAQLWHLRQLHKSYILIRKRCLMFMSLLAASERAEKNPLKIKFRKDIVESYKPIVYHRFP